MLLQTCKCFFLPWNTKGDVTALLHKMKVDGDQGLSNSKRERENTSKYSTCLLKPYDSFVRRLKFTVSHFSLKFLLDSCGHHSLSLYIKEQLWHSAINNAFCVPYRFEKIWEWANDDRIFIFVKILPLTDWHTGFNNRPDLDAYLQCALR